MRAEALNASSEGSSSIGSLLMDILVYFCTYKEDRVLSRELVEYLNTCEGRPWAEALKGKVATDSWLAAQLRPYGIRPRLLRKGELVGRGYVKEECNQPFRRYIPRAEVEEVRRSMLETCGGGGECKAEESDGVRGNNGTSGQG